MFLTMSTLKVYIREEYLTIINKISYTCTRGLVNFVVSTCMTEKKNLSSRLLCQQRNIENIEEDFFHRHIQQRPTFTFTSHPDTKTTIYTKNRALEYRQIDVSAFPTEFSCLIPRKANENPSILISKV